MKKNNQNAETLGGKSMEEKIFVEAYIDFKTIDEKFQNFLRARKEFGRAAYELREAVEKSMFKFEFKGSPLFDTDNLN